MSGIRISKRRNRRKATKKAVVRRPNPLMLGDLPITQILAELVRMGLMVLWAVAFSTLAWARLRENRAYGIALALLGWGAIFGVLAWAQWEEDKTDTDTRSWGWGGKASREELRTFELVLWTAWHTAETLTEFALVVSPILVAAYFFGLKGFLWSLFAYFIVFPVWFVCYAKYIAWSHARWVRSQKENSKGLR